MLVLAASPAAAISRYNPLFMSCAGVRAAIHNQGAVIFRYQSPRGLPLYDRYVRNSNDCEATDYAEWTRSDKGRYTLPGSELPKPGQP